ncbi:Protein SENSITIVITY TO RED LIGHT REDUCED 1 [Durusdinium trenchii]|uniref:Protein SENSITIVITY TO RED LIGHT REDUCED 1 n=1 Tax=Durusdinium trenchii TaxID=1381693 RepID=A0ABP0M8J3_9DINO
MAWLLQQESVIRISFHQCMTGLRVSPEGPSRKDTSFVANHLGLAALLSEYQCDHGHEHLALQNGLPKKAQAYPTELVHIILQGISLSSTPLSCYDSSFPTLEDEETEAAEQVEEDEPDDAEPRRPLGELERRQAEQLAADQVKKVKLLHVNLGHISTEKMLVLLKAARAKEAVMRFVKDSYRCEQCQKQKRPIERRKATMPRTFSFNRYIDVVIFYIALQGKTLAYLNVICHGANFQQIQWLQRYDAGTPSSRSVWQAFLAAWLKPFGNPEVVLSDGGSEFKDCFERHLEQYGILQVISDAASPWQNGRVERHGGWLKEKAEDELSSGNSIVSSPEDLNEVPWQDVVADAYDLDTAGAEFARAQKLRQKARKLCVQFTSSEKVRLGSSHRPRKQTQWAIGQWALVWRRSAQSGSGGHITRSRWVGPGVVVLQAGGEPNPETPADKRRRLSTTSQSSDGQSVSQRVAEVEDRETQRLQRIAEKELQRLDRLDRLRARREGSTSSASIDQPLLRVPMPTETSTDYTPTEPGEENLFCLETVREPEISLMVKPINPKNSEFDMKNATPEEIDGFKAAKVIVGEEANNLRRQFRDRILRSRIIRRKKPMPGTLQEFFGKLGFRPSLLESCWLIKEEHGAIVAFVLIEVDDLNIAANPKYFEFLQKKLTERFRFGKWEFGEADFAGRRVRFEKDGVLMDQQKYILEKLQVIKPPRGQLGNKEDLLQGDVFEQYRSMLYRVNWLAHPTRPEAAGTVSILSSRLNRASVYDLGFLNRMVQRIKGTASQPLVLHNFDNEKMIFISASDAGGVASKPPVPDDLELTDTVQGAWVIFISDQLPNASRKVKVSTVSWRSTKLKRRVSSTLASEALAFSQALTEIEWLLLARASELKGRLEQCNITDAKSLYASSRQNRRTAVELAIILEALTRARSVVRWSPHPRMVADTLTKEDISRSNGALEETLRSSRLSLWDEEAELERRRQCPSSKLRSKRAPSSFREELVLLASLINKDWGELSESDLLSVHEG